MLEFHVFA